MVGSAASELAMRGPLLSLLLILLATGASPALAAERPNPYLSQARVYYLGLEYERCVERLHQAAQWKSTPAEQVEVEIYSGLCKFDLHDEKNAADHFRMALRLNPDARLPPDTSPPIRRLFESVAAQVPRPAPAGTEATGVTPSQAPVGSHVPAVPQTAPLRLTPAPPPPPPAGFDLPPAPQSRRSWVLPASLAGAAVAVGVTALVFGLQARSLETQANAATQEIDAFNLGNTARRDAVISNVGTGVAASLGVGAILSYFLQPAGPPEPTRSSP